MRSGALVVAFVAACGGSHDQPSDTSTTCDGCQAQVPDPIPPDRVTAWNPGILIDTQLGLPLGLDGIPTRTMVCATLTPGNNIQAAIDACPEGQVVQLGAGTFTVAATITLTRGVVLRGTGSQGAPAGTTIMKTGGQTVLAIGTTQDQICYGGTATDLVADAAHGATTIVITPAAAASFHTGDLALIDVGDDAAVQEGDCAYFKRVDKRSASERVDDLRRGRGDGHAHARRPSALDVSDREPVPGADHPRDAAGDEVGGHRGGAHRGWHQPGYDGQMAGGIDISNAAFSWVKDVQTDTVGGMHVAVTGTYRCVVRDSYVHHSANYGYAQDCYGIVLRCGAADNLVENNIVRYMNKPILFNVSGGGNVVAYNYVDNSWATPPEWQEVNIDVHCSSPTWS